MQRESKPRKKSDGRWSESEQEKFLNALQIYGKNWYEIQKFIPTRSLSQIRSHAQKQLKKMTSADIEVIDQRTIAFKGRNTSENVVDSQQVYSEEGRCERQGLVNSSSKGLKQMLENKDPAQTEEVAINIQKIFMQEQKQYNIQNGHGFFFELFLKNFDFFRNGGTFFPIEEQKQSSLC